MGMYTELVMNVSLEDDMDEDVANLLKRMIDCDPINTPPESVKDHPLFATDRWRYMLNTGSFYFVPAGNSKMVEHDQGRKIRHISIRTDLKNYSDEIDLFADFVAPYVEAFDDPVFAGYKRYEENDHPTLLYIVDRKPEWRPVTHVPENN